MGVRALAALLAVATGSFACVQRAILLPVLQPTLTALAAVSRPTGAAALAESAAGAGSPEAAAKGGARFILRPADSKLEVRGGDLLTGMHVMTFTRWRGAFVTAPGSPPDRPSGRLTIDIDLPSLEADFAVFDSLRNHLLEVDKFPWAHFAGTLRPRSDQPDGYVFQGRLAVHGVERAIRFYATLQPSSSGYRIGSEFDMSRDAFAMHRHDTIDLVIYDDFRVLLDLQAHPEHVSAEVLPAQ